MNSSGNVTYIHPDDYEMYHYDNALMFRFVAMGILIPLGFILNTLAFSVFLSSPRLRRSVTGRYFMSLAISDNLVLVGELLLWLNTQTSSGPILGVSFMNNLTSMCRFVQFLRYLSRMLSSWITVAITVERYISVTSLRSKSIWFRPAIIVTIEFFLSFALASFALVYLEVMTWRGVSSCFISNSIYFYLLIVIKGIVGELLVPSVIVLVLTILIINVMIKARQAQKSQTEPSPSTGRDKLFPRATVTLLVVAIAFIVLRFPYMIVYLMRKPVHTHIAYFLDVANYSVIFIVFCATEKVFRNEMRRWFRCKNQAAENLSEEDNSTDATDPVVE